MAERGSAYFLSEDDLEGEKGVVEIVSVMPLLRLQRGRDTQGRHPLLRQTTINHQETDPLDPFA